MSKSTPIITALDIGTTKVCAIVARLNLYGRLEILGVGKADSIGVTRGVISNIDKTVNAIISAVQQASRRAGVEVHNVYVGVAGQHIKNMQRSGYLMRERDDDEITREDIDRLITDMSKISLPPGEQIIHILPQEYAVDNETGIKDPIGMSGIRFAADFHIITGQTAALKNIERCVTKAGLSMAGLILEPIASAAAVLTEEEKEAGIALVDIGGGTTDLAVFHDGLIRYTSVIPLGGQVITDDIREGCMVMKEQAEKLKVKFGCALAAKAQHNAIVAMSGLPGREAKEISLRNLAHIIQARMEEMLELIYIKLNDSGYQNKLIGGVVITGGGARLAHLKSLTSYITAADTRVGLPTEHLANGRKEFSDPMFATSIGLAIEAARSAEPVPTEKQAEPEPEPQLEPVAVLEEQLNFAQNAVAEETLVDSDEIRENSYDSVESEAEKTGWFGNFIRKSKEWLESDMRDFS